MNDLWNREMLEATRLTRAGRLGTATALLQRPLRGEATTAAASNAARGRAAGRIDITPDGSPTPVRAPLDAPRRRRGHRRSGA